MPTDRLFCFTMRRRLQRYDSEAKDHRQCLTTQNFKIEVSGRKNKHSLAEECRSDSAAVVVKEIQCVERPQRGSLQRQ